MKNRVIISVLLIALCAGLGWGQFYTAYTAAERESLADAYYLAGQAYKAVGKTAKGAEFMQMARNIDQAFDPARISETEQASAAELLAEGRAVVIGVPAEERAAALSIDSFFLRFVGSLVAEDPQQAAGFLDGSVYLTKLGQVLTRAQAQTQLKALFDSVKLNEMAPSSVYKLDTMVVMPAPQTVTQAWGPTWVMRVDAKEDFSSYLPFWEMSQQFYIRLVNNDFYITAIGQKAPPAAWKPAAPPPPAAPAPAPVPAGEISQAVTDAFNGFVSALLAKNADGAASFLAPQVRLVRLQQTMSASDLKASFANLAASSSFGSAKIGDVIDTGSIFVQPSTDFAKEVPGAAYVLTVMTKVDLSEAVPFWATWQGYYFQQQQGNWKIFAIR